MSAIPRRRRPALAQVRGKLRITNAAGVTRIVTKTSAERDARRTVREAHQRNGRTPDD